MCEKSIFDGDILNLKFTSNSFESFVASLNKLIENLELPFLFPTEELEFFTFFYEYIFVESLWYIPDDIVINYTYNENTILFTIQINNLHFISSTFLFENETKSIVSIETEYSFKK